MPRLRFVNKLTEEAKQQLEAIYHDHADFALRRRAHALLLSDRGFTIGQLLDIFAVDRDTVSAWLDLFEQSGAEGLKPLQRPGRPAIHTIGIYTADEVRQLKELVDRKPRQVKQAQAALLQATGKFSSTETLKRALKKLGYSWHCYRRSLRSRRDPDSFAIEILWRNIKRDWLPLSCYTCYAKLKNAVLEILGDFGSKYRIYFV